MANKFFGTDGIRGIANTELSCELAMDIGRATGTVFSKYYGHKPTFIIGKDPRSSSDMLEHALTAGICSVGADAILLGVIPTPAIAYLINKYKASAGFMISASHNPARYNGIKIFNNDGYKLPDELELEIEKLLEYRQFNLISNNRFGKISVANNAIDDYINYIKDNIGQTDFSNLKVALDCANGCASKTAAKLFSSLGIDFLTINDQPDGFNINKNCGSTDLKSLSDFVRDNNCDIGFAFDGDADRCLIIDEIGDCVHGDKIIAIFAKYLKDKNLLSNNTFVVTMMSNLGLLNMAKENDINFKITKVGDRYVLDKMKEGGFSLGGEPSGHIILLDHSTTGDGQFVATYFLKILKELNLKVSQLANIMVSYPQILINIENPKNYNVLQDLDILDSIKFFERQLDENGRILVRPSGTEPLVRLMVEGPNEAKIKNIANSLSTLIKNKIGDR